MDGTLRDGSGQVPKENIRAIRQAQKYGVKVVLCSGRWRENLLESARQIGGIEYLICNNGADIYDIKNDKTIFLKTVSKKACIDIYRFIKKSTLNAKYLNLEGAFYIKENNQNLPIIKNFKEFLDANKIPQVTIVGTDYDSAIKFINYVEHHKSIYVGYAAKCLVYREEIIPNNVWCWLDIVNEKCSKGSGVKILCKYLKIDKRNACAMGDGYNDLSMLKNVKYSVAMGNSSAELKNIASFVTLNNDEYGVAHYIKYAIKNKIIK